MSIGRQVARMGSLSCSVIFLTVPVMVSYLTFGLGSISSSPLVIIRSSQPLMILAWMRTGKHCRRKSSPR